MATYEKMDMLYKNVYTTYETEGRKIWSLTSFQVLNSRPGSKKVLLYDWLTKMEGRKTDELMEGLMDGQNTCLDAKLVDECMSGCVNRWMKRKKKRDIDISYLARLYVCERWPHTGLITEDRTKSSVYRV